MGSEMCIRDRYARDNKPGLIFDFLTLDGAYIQAGLTFKRGLHFLSENFVKLSIQNSLKKHRKSSKSTKVIHKTDSYMSKVSTLQNYHFQLRKEKCGR